jgi:hypothetical protein
MGWGGSINLRSVQLVGLTVAFGNPANIEHRLRYQLTPLVEKGSNHYEQFW